MTKLIDVTAEQQYVLAVTSIPSDFERWPLEPSEFSDSECITLMRIVRDLHDRGEPISSLDVLREAQRTDAHLSQQALLWGVGVVPAVVVHRRLRELATARRLRAAFMQCASECEALRVEVAEQMALEVLDGMKRTTESNIEQSRTTVKRIIQEFMSGQRTSLTATGITKIDLVIGGVEPGTLTFIGGDTGVGKSSLMLHMADRMMQSKKRPGFISCEDSRQVLGTRIVSSFSGVSGLRIRRGDFSQNDVKPLERAVGVAADRSMPIAYEIGSTDAQVAAAMSTLVREHGCDVIFVDYIQTINCSDGSESRREDVRRIASRIKGAAARLNVPVIVGSQISVGDIHAEFKEPGKHALKESRDLTNMAEWVIVIWSDDGLGQRYSMRGPAVVGKLAKSKCGGDGTRFVFGRKDDGVLREVDEVTENAYA